MMDLFDLMDAIADECYKDYVNKQKAKKKVTKVKPTMHELKPSEKVYGHFTKIPMPKKQDTIKKDIENVIFNDKRKETTIFWQNGDVTRVTCQEDDEYNRYVGFYAAVCKHALGNKGNFNDTVEYWVEKREKEAAERKAAKEKAKAEAKKTKPSTNDIMKMLGDIWERLDNIESAKKGVNCDRS